MKQKWCTKCKILKEWNDFSSMKKDPTKKNSWCKKCEDDKNKKWAEKNPEKVKEYSKQHHLKELEENRRRHSSYYHNNKESRKKKIKINAMHRIGWNEEYFNYCKDTQKNKCAICGNEESCKDGKSGKIRELSMDHNHSTGKARELLCSKCNQGIRALKEDVVVLENAIKYLKKHSNNKELAIVADADDCLVGFSDTAVELTNLMLKTCYTREDLNTWDLPKEVYDTYKKYEGVGFYGCMPVLPGVVETLNDIRSSYRMKIIILTAREEKFRDITILNLKMKGVVYDEIIFSKKKGEELIKLSEKYEIKMFVDDKLENVEEAISTGMVGTVCLMDMRHNRVLGLDEKIKRVRSLRECLQYVK